MLHRYLLAVWLFIMNSAFIACSEPTQSQTTASPQDPVPQVSIEPADLTSSVRGTPVRVSVWREGPAIPDALVDSIAKSIEVVVNGKSVSADVEILPRVDQTVGAKERRDIAVSLPSWSSAWHEIRIYVPKSEAEPVLMSVSKAAAEGQFRARIHPDSAPVIRFIYACALNDRAKDPAVHATLAFSENVRFNPDIAMQPGVLNLSLDGVLCAPQWTSSVTADGSAGEYPIQPATTERVYMVCTAEGDLSNASMQLTIGDLRGALDAPVMYFGGAFQEVTDDATVTTADQTCRLWTF